MHMNKEFDMFWPVAIILGIILLGAILLSAPNQDIASDSGNVETICTCKCGTLTTGYSQ